LHTSDLHGQLHGYDYAHDRPGAPKGLMNLTGLIKQKRAESENSLLFDTGDFLHGNPISDPEAQQQIPAHKRTLGSSAIIGLMNRLGYDAITLGNHEFDLGLHHLHGMLHQMHCPVILSNLEKADDEASLLTQLPQHVLLVQTLRHEETSRDIKIGLIGLVPPQTAHWELPELLDKLRFSPMRDAAAQSAATLRTEGADLVIALAHTGIGTDRMPSPPDHSALAIAEIDGIDVVLCGHQHRHFPSEDFAALARLNDSAIRGKIDPVKGRVAECPATMPGSFGSHLGQIDLSLRHSRTDEGRMAWHIEAYQCRLVPADEADPGMEPLIIPYHEAARKLACTPLGRIDRPIHSHFARFANDTSVQLIAHAQMQAARDILRGTPDEDLPLLSAATCFRNGGPSGRDTYLDIPPGTLQRRHLGELYPFHDTLCLARLTGRDLRLWLEGCARNFRTIKPGVPDQPLLDPSIPGYLFDHIIGVTYALDLSAPPLAIDAEDIDPQTSGRVRALAWRGRAVTDSQSFVVAGNSFRMSGAGGIPSQAKLQPIHTSEISIKDVITRYLRDTPLNLGETPEDVWRLLPVAGASLRVPSVKTALPYLHEIQHMRPEVVATTPLGTLALRLHL
jgi:2',3'-cyclic-nucleotide 2'-phosphodiesterase/3'-nucleotidase